MASFKTRIRNKKRLAICGLGALLLLQNRAVRKRRWWVRPWATEGRRQNQGMANNLGEVKSLNQNANLKVTVIIIYNQKQTVYFRVY